MNDTIRSTFIVERRLIIVDLSIVIGLSTLSREKSALLILSDIPLKKIIILLI